MSNATGRQRFIVIVVRIDWKLGNVDTKGFIEIKQERNSNNHSNFYNCCPVAAYSVVFERQCYSQQTLCAKKSSTPIRCHSKNLVNNIQYMIRYAPSICDVEILVVFSHIEIDCLR